MLWWRWRLFSSLLLQRIVFNAHEVGGVVLGRGVWATSLGIGQLFHARSPQQPRMAIITFDAARLVVEPVVLVALPRELLLGGPWSGPHRRILDCHDIFERLGTGAPPALDQMKVLTRALVIGLLTEVGDVDDQRVALPTSARVAVPLAHAGRQMRPPVYDDVALPALTLPDVVKDRDTARSLHDPAEAASCGAELRQPQSQTAIRQGAILRSIMAIDAHGVVARRRLGPSR